MIKIKDNEKLDKYIHKYKLDEFFTYNMKCYMELFKFEKNEHICKCNERIKYIYFLVEGKTKIYRLLSNGKVLLLCFNSPFMVAGDIEFINKDIADSNIQAIETTYCIGIDLKYIRKFSLNDSKFLRNMCHALSEKLCRISNNSSINLLYPLENRLASYIVAFTVSKENNKIFLHGNLKEVSELLGTSYRHLIRTLNKFCSEEILKKYKEHYEILALKKLIIMAGDLYQ